eukprot:828092_1
MATTISSPTQLCATCVKDILVDKHRLIMEMTSQFHDVVRQLYRHPHTKENNEIMENILNGHTEWTSKFEQKYIKYITEFSEIKLEPIQIELEPIPHVTNTPINNNEAIDNVHEQTQIHGCDYDSEKTVSEDDIDAVTTDRNTTEIHGGNKARNSYNDEQTEPTAECVMPSKQKRKRKNRYESATTNENDEPNTNTNNSNKKHYVGRKSKSITKKRQLKCSYCDKRFQYYSKLKRHERVHTGERPYKCTFEFCSKRFKQKHDMWRHQRLHTGKNHISVQYARNHSH